MARSNDADASAMASLASARRYAYLSSIVHAEEDDEDDVRTRAMGTLSAMVASVGLCERGARVGERRERDAERERAGAGDVGESAARGFDERL